MSIETNFAIPSEPPLKIEKSEDEVGNKWTNVQIDSQVLSLFMACPTKYNYIFNRHLVPIQGVSDGIRRGLIIHDGLLQYWKIKIAGGDFKVAVQDSLKVVQFKLNADDKFNAEYKLKTLQSYLDFLKYLQTVNWIPLEAEKYFKVKIYEDESIRLRIYLTGRIDLIVRLPQIHILPIDFKTESERWFYSQMSNQFRIYSMVCKVNLMAVQRVGFQETVKAEEKFKLETIAFDPDVLEEYRTITIPHYVKQMMMAQEDGFYPQNNTSCISGHFKCQFSDGNDHKGICTVTRALREQKISRYFVVGPEWDPARVE